MKRLLMMVVSACALAFTGCVTSPFLDEDATKRMAAVDALSEQRKLAEVALDYCTAPYQELPTGCQMDVRRRAVERLADRDLLMAVASFSIVKATVKATVKGYSCYVDLGEPNAELRKLALDKLTEDKYIVEVLSAKDPFAIPPLFKKALFGYYQIDGQPPETAKEAWYATAKGKEKSVAKAFCSCLGGSASAALCKEVFSLLPASQSAEVRSAIKDTYKQVVTGAPDVNAAIRVLQLTAVMPEGAIVKDDIDGMCKKVCANVSTIKEFTAFGSLVNGDAKKYLSDPDGLIKSAATQVVPKLNGMNEIAAFADVLKTSKSPWIGQIGIEDAVRKCAAEMNSITAIKTFAQQAGSFNEIMVPNKADIADIVGDAIIAVLNAVVEGRAVATAQAPAEETRTNGRDANRAPSTQPGQKETIDDFVKAVTEFSADLLSDKVIVAIFANEGIYNAYRGAIRADGFREDMGNELAEAVMRSGSFGDMLAAGMLMGAMGDKESPKYTKMFAHLLSNIRKSESFIEAAKYAKIYYPRNMLVEEAEKRMDDMTLAKCLVAVFGHSPESDWCIGKTLTIGERFAQASKEDPLTALQPVFVQYAKYRDSVVGMRAVSCFNNPEAIEEYLLSVKFDSFEKGNFLAAYMRALSRAVALYAKQGAADKGALLEGRVAESLADGVSEACQYLRKPDFAFPSDVTPLMSALTENYPKLWARIMAKVKLPPYSIEYEDVALVLEHDPEALVDFLAVYKCEPYWKEGEPLSVYKKDCDYLPIYYYDCEWYSQALCAASGMKLSDEARKRLNEKMVYFAINGLEVNARKTVFDAIVGASDKKAVTDAWAQAKSEIEKRTTELFNFSLDDSMTEMKKEKVWGETYKNKRILLRGIVMDASDTKLILDGGSDVKDMKFAEKLPSANADPSLRFAMENRERELKDAEEDVKRAKSWVDTAKSWVDTKKKAKNPRDSDAEQLKKAEAKLAMLKEKRAKDIKIVLKYSVDIPKKYADDVAELKKGDTVVFEAYPYPVYPSTSSSDISNGVRTFTSRMREGRIINEK